MNDALDELEERRKSFWEHTFWEHPIGTGVGMAIGGAFVAFVLALLAGRKYRG